MSLALFPAEQTLADQIQALITQFRLDMDDESKRATRIKTVEVIGEKGRALHDSLAARGHEPVHTKHLMDGRMKTLSDPEFYRNLDAARSLLRFIDDPSTAGDPPDESGFKYAFV